MRLSVFILDNLERILREWEDFASSLLPGRSMSVAALRDHAEQMLRFVAANIETEQSESQRLAKSLGHVEVASDTMTAGQEHGLARATERFTVDEMVSEYRALRASVARLWLGHPGASADEARQLVRFNEAIDQLLAESMKQFIAKESQDSEMFTAVIGHDLRNPLNAVAMAAQLLGSSDAISAHDRQILDRIHDAVARQGRLLDQLSDFSRVRLGGFRRIERVECDLHDLCGNVVDELRLANPDIDLTRSGDTRASVDRLRVEQLVSNLLANAIQHGSIGGRITIAVVGTADHVEIAVHNDGSPIAADHIGTIFRPFVSGAEDRGDHRGRLGLGLFIAHQIALAHGGSMSVESRADAGTTFTARLPRR
jgi:signal transduction histidine kinase